MSGFLRRLFRSSHHPDLSKNVEPLVEEDTPPDYARVVKEDEPFNEDKLSMEDKPSKDDTPSKQDKPSKKSNAFEQVSKRKLSLYDIGNIAASISTSHHKLWNMRRSPANKIFTKEDRLDKIQWMIKRTAALTRAIEARPSAVLDQLLSSSINGIITNLAEDSETECNSDLAAAARKLNSAQRIARHAVDSDVR